MNGPYTHFSDGHKRILVALHSIHLLKAKPDLSHSMHESWWPD